MSKKLTHFVEPFEPLSTSVFGLSVTMQPAYIHSLYRLGRKSECKDIDEEKEREAFRFLAHNDNFSGEYQMRDDEGGRVFTGDIDEVIGRGCYSLSLDKKGNAYLLLEVTADWLATCAMSDQATQCLTRQGRISPGFQASHLAFLDSRFADVQTQHSRRHRQRRTQRGRAQTLRARDRTQRRRAQTLRVRDRAQIT